MNKYRLPLIFATCIVLESVQAGQKAPDSGKPGISAFDMVPLADGIAMAKLEDITAMLSATPAGMARARPAKAAANKPAAHDQRNIAFVDARQLDNQAVEKRARALFEQGTPVAVYTPPGTPAVQREKASRLFGVASAADLAVYIQAENGRVQAFSTSVGKNPHLSPLAVRLEHFRESVAKQLDVLAERAAREAARPAKARNAPAGSAYAAHLPIMRFDNTEYRDGGASLTRSVTIVRDSTSDKDNFNVHVKTSGPIIGSSRNCNDNPSCQFHYIRQYVVEVLLGFDDATQPTALASHPQSTGLTALNYEKSAETTTSFGFNLDLGMEAGLQGMVPNASVKRNFGFNFSKSHTTTESISFTINDYSIAATSIRDGTYYGKRWTYGISNTALYAFFNHGTITPAMSMLEPETYSLWSFPATKHGRTLYIHAVSNAYKKYRSGREDNIGGVRTSNIIVDLDSPYLHREPVVLLHSQQGSGRCLVNNKESSVVLGECDKSPGSKTAHWYLDSSSRYVSRHDGKCLAVHTSNERQVELATCNESSEQKWRWIADRIHSEYDGRRPGWRLYIDGETVKARTDAERHQSIPDNPNHELLNPWSTYPDAPVDGATIPTLAGQKQPAIPGTWVGSIRAVPPEERWTLEVLRQY